MPYTIQRTGDTPLIFSGKTVCGISGDYVNGKQLNRWFDLQLYSTTDGLYVASVIYQTRWQGETDRSDAHCGSASEVAAWLTEYDPQNCVEGYPTGEAYRERQERLMRTICDHYEHRVGELLVEAVAHDPAFGTTPQVEHSDQYSGLDHEAIMSWVRAQLADFPITKAEACVICDANNGALLIEYSWMGLAANILDTPAKSLSQKWDCDAESLVKRLQDADRGTQFALSYAVAQFWRRTDQPTEKALVVAGFVIAVDAPK